MARYIDADKYKTDLLAGQEYLDENTLLTAINLLDCQPTADVVEVRHGRWIEHYAYECWHYDCPFCDDGYATKERDNTPTNYCPNCGAKMDGKDEKNAEK